MNSGVERKPGGEGEGGGRESGREGGRESGREGRKEGGREGGRGRVRISDDGGIQVGDNCQQKTLIPRRQTERCWRRNKVM